MPSSEHVPASEQDGPRRAKRQRLDHDTQEAPLSTSSSSRAVITLDQSVAASARPVMTVSSLRIDPPSTRQTAVVNAPQFQQPLHLTQFSYSPSRQLLNDLDNSNSSLGWLIEETKWLPPASSQGRINLNDGYEECVWRDETVDEGLGALLDTLQAWHDRDSTGFAQDCLNRNKVYTWRGMMTRLMLTAYESVDDRAQGWEMNAMMLDGALYLEDANSPEKLAAKASGEASSKRFAYHGIAFEGHMVTPDQSLRSSAPSEALPNNTNVQWCSIVKTNLDGHRMILGGEVDCLRSRTNARSRDGQMMISTENFVELKTNMVIRNERDEINFEKNKLMKHFAQSFLLGVPTVIVGFRDRSGFLTTVQEFKTLDLPRLVRGKPHAWDKTILLSSASQILSFIVKTISTTSTMLDKQKQFETFSTLSAQEDEDNDYEHVLNEWPVYRIKFEPRTREVTIRQLDRREVEQQVWAAKVGSTKDRRVGFLKRSWVESVIRRRKSEMKVQRENKVANSETVAVGEKSRSVLNGL
ncbi:hypothetical protein ACM66B_003990 [Microbotryomycetes sp. NB124-2]